MAFQQQAGMSSAAQPRALFVKSLSKCTTERHMVQLFSPFGLVRDVQIARHRSGRSAGFAIVSFSTHEEAAAAMSAMDNAVFMGRKLSVRWYQPERDSAQTQAHMAMGIDLQALGLAGFMPQAPVTTDMLLSQLPAFQEAAASLMAAKQAVALSKWIGSAHSHGQIAMANEQQRNNHARWSSLVNMWLNNYQESQDAPSANSSSGGAAMDLARRSIDANCGPCRRRTTQNSLSLSLEGLNLSSHSLDMSSVGALPALHFSAGGAPPSMPHPSQHQLQQHGHHRTASTAGSSSGMPPMPSPADIQAFNKSRLATKWGRPPNDTMATADGIYCLSEGGSSSRGDLHTIADTQLPSSLAGAAAMAGQPRSQANLPSGSPVAGTDGSEAPSCPSGPCGDKAAVAAAVVFNSLAGSAAAAAWTSHMSEEDAARRISLDGVVYDQQRQRQVIAAAAAAVAAASVSGGGAQQAPASTGGSQGGGRTASSGSASPTGSCQLPPLLAPPAPPASYPAMSSAASSSGGAAPLSAPSGAPGQGPLPGGLNAAALSSLASMLPGLAGVDLAPLIAGPGPKLGQQQQHQQQMLACAQAQQLSAAQQQYASALAQVAAARDQMLKAVAAVQQQPQSASSPLLPVPAHAAAAGNPALLAAALGSLQAGGPAPPLPAGGQPDAASMYVAMLQHMAAAGPRPMF